MIKDIKDKWARINGFLDWDDFMTIHTKTVGNYIPENIINELIELALEL